MNLLLHYVNNVDYNYYKFALLFWQDGAFRKHVKTDHNRWDYMYIWLHLSQMDPNDHNAHDKYIWKKVSGNHCIIRK